MLRDFLAPPTAVAKPFVQTNHFETPFIESPGRLG